MTLSGITCARGGNGCIAAQSVVWAGAFTYSRSGGAAIGGTASVVASPDVVRPAAVEHSAEASCVASASVVVSSLLRSCLAAVSASTQLSCTVQVGRGCAHGVVAHAVLADVRADQFGVASIHTPAFASMACTSQRAARITSVQSGRASIFVGVTVNYKLDTVCGAQVTAYAERVVDTAVGVLSVASVSAVARLGVSQNIMGNSLVTCDSHRWRVQPVNVASNAAMSVVVKRTAVCPEIDVNAAGRIHAVPNRARQSSASQSVANALTRGEPTRARGINPVCAYPNALLQLEGVQLNPLAPGSEVVEVSAMDTVIEVPAIDRIVLVPAGASALEVH